MKEVCDEDVLPIGLMHVRVYLHTGPGREFRAWVLKAAPNGKHYPAAHVRSNYFDG